MTRIFIILYFIVILNNPTQAQSSTSPFDSLVIQARQALVYEDVHRTNYFIQLIKPASTSQNKMEVFNSLMLEKVVLERNLTEANKYLEQALKSRSELLHVHALVMEGRILNQQLQFKKSVEVLEKVKVKIGQKQNPLREELLHWLGNSTMETGDYKKATQYLQEAIAICKSDSNQFYIKLAQARITQGINYKRTGNYHAAEREYLLAINILENTPFAKYRELSRAYINLGNVYNEQWSYTPAREYYLKSLQLNQTHLRDSNQLTILYNNIALFYQRFGNLLKSKEYYDKWFELFNSNKQSFKDSAPAMLINYGTFLSNVFEYEREDKVLQEATLFITNNTDPESQVRLLLAKGHNFESTDRLDSTKVQLNKARNILLKHPEISKSLWYTFYAQESVLSTNRKKFKEADSLIYLAIETVKSSDDSNALADAYRIQGLNFELQLQHFAATESFKKALKVVSGIFPEYHPQRIALLNNTGISFFGNKEADSARYYLMLAIQFNQFPAKSDDFLYSDPFEILVSNFYLLQLAMMQPGGPSKEDEAFVLSSYSIIENKRQSLKSFEDQKGYNKAVRDFFDVAVEYYKWMFTSTGEQNYFNKAFEMAEKARYQSLQHSLRNVRIGEFAGVTQKIVRDEQIIQKKISLLSKQLLEEIGLGADSNPDLLKEYNTSLFSLQQQYDHMLDSVRSNLPGFYNLKFSSAAVSPQELQKELLQPEMALIQYYVSYDKVYALIISQDYQTILEIKDKTSLLKSIRKLSNVNKLQLSREYVPVAHELYERLIKPVDSVLMKRKINHYVIIPDGEINYVPFDVLITKPVATLSKCRFLLADKILSYGYSSTLLWQEFSGYKQEFQNIKVLSYAPAFKTESINGTDEHGLRGGAAKTHYATYDFQPLQMNVAEVKSISTIFEKKGYQNESMFDYSADEASFKSKDLNQYQIIHLATHGFVDYPTTLSSGIAFSFNQTSGEDGILFMDEIFSLRFNTHLVCLSACQTGFGQVDVGEGMMSMTRAFLYAGAKNLVVSLWAVQDNSTSVLMENFYKQFVKSKSISLSLRKAKLEMLEGEEFSHPYNWAGFIHVGMN